MYRIYFPKRSLCFDMIFQFYRCEIRKIYVFELAMSYVYLIAMANFFTLIFYF